MREIKFRAWDKYQEQMIPSVESGVYEDPDGIIDFDTVLSLERYVVMQYTGLQDKNSEEIYEGDVIEFNGGETESRSKMQVIWDDEFAEYSLLAFKENWCYELGSCPWNTIEVIGNIYEDSHLLEGATNER